MPDPTRPSEIFQISARLIFPVLLLFSAAHLVNADIQPGEGFSGGLLLGLSNVLLYVGLGVEEVDRGMPRLARFGVASGLSLCTAFALVPLLLGDPMLRVYGTALPLGRSELSLSTRLVFETGIFLVLAGGTLELFRRIGFGREGEEGP